MMSRTLSRDPSVHRVLDRRLDGGPQLGDDVEKLSAACRKRLGARGYPEVARPGRTSALNSNLADRCADALFALGASSDTVKAARAGKVTVGAQRMIRYPGLRTTEQEHRADEREHEVAKRASAERAQAAAKSTHAHASHSTAEFRKRCTDAAEFALRHSGRVYTQGAGRWNPIRSGASPVTGKIWSSADCSSFATWVVWHGVGRSGPDIVNGADWAAGFTGTMRVHGRRVTDGHYQPGDCAIYGGGSGSHTTVCYRAGTAATALWASHGSPGGPRSLPLHYRGDLGEVRRYVG